jgi:hypothetical protein
LDIWNLSPSSLLLTVVISPIKGWDLKTQKGASDFGCLKDKWARFECKSELNFLVLYLGSNPRCLNY